MKILGLRTHKIDVENLDESKAFYTRLFRVAPYFDEPFYVGFNLAGFELGLTPIEGQVAAPPGRVVTYWGVEDIQAAWTHALSVGAQAVESPNDVGGGIWVATVSDPEGNPVGLIVNPHFSLTPTP